MYGAIFAITAYEHVYLYANTEKKQLVKVSSLKFNVFNSFNSLVLGELCHHLH